MALVRLSGQAQANIEGIWEFIGNGQNRPEAAKRQVEMIFDKLDLLAVEPLMGEARDDLRLSLRVFAAGSYAILYYPREEGISVAGIIHGARDFGAMVPRGRTMIFSVSTCVPSLATLQP